MIPLSLIVVAPLGCPVLSFFWKGAGMQLLQSRDDRPEWLQLNLAYIHLLRRRRRSNSVLAELPITPLEARSRFTFCADLLMFSTTSTFSPW